jgi:hypothetical protein
MREVVFIAPLAVGVNVTNMELKDTINWMTSNNYKERFIAEYQQLKIRIKSLEKMLEDWSKGKLEFQPTCPKDLLKEQLWSMREYRKCLRKRALIENINL